MSRFPEDRSFLEIMSKQLLWLTGNFTVDNRTVPFEELLSSDTLLTELAHQLSRRHGWPLRTHEEVRQELRRLHARWIHCRPRWKTECQVRDAIRCPHWIEESEDDDDVFMPSVTAMREAARKEAAKKEAAKKEAARKGKAPSSSKDKKASSSKGKSAQSSKD